MELSEFRDDLLNRADTRAAVDGVFTADAFMAEAIDLLVGTEEVNTLDQLSFSGTGRRRQLLAVHGYDRDEQDKSVALAVLHYVGGSELPTLTYTDATSTFRALEEYLREALSGDFVIEREPAYPEYQLAQTLQELAARKGEDAISRFRLYIVSDAMLSSRAKAVPSTEVHGIPVEFHIWDIQRFFQVHDAGRTREPLQLRLSEWGIEGVPALCVADRARDVTTYLAALPGELLAALYRQHGSRLLEGNVRSFLTVRGKINRGIRDTVMKDPGHFLAYNNGISATASAVDYVDGLVTSITDLQIVNGGQTTASLFYATQGAKDLSLEDVFVQMKLVVVSAEEATEMVPLISRYANSQNAVREDDFFSNSPFHVRMEELSKKLLAPAKAGLNFQTKWYYERTRGQYLNERNRRSAAEQRKFEAEYPRAQVITKADAAKYVVAWERQPHQVSGGAQKNFKAFAGVVAEAYAKNPDQFADSYYRRLVAKAVLFNSVRAAIAKADWYEAGYLANLAAYAVAKLSLELARDSRTKDFDLLRLWDLQRVPDAMLAEAVELGRMARDVLTSPDRLVVNVTEWAKREAAWTRLANAPHRLSNAAVGDCLPMTLNANGEKAATKGTLFETAVSDRRSVQIVGEPTWRSVRTFLQGRALLSSADQRCLREVIPTRAGLLDSDIASALLNLYVKAYNLGWRPDGS